MPVTVVTAPEASVSNVRLLLTVSIPAILALVLAPIVISTLVLWINEEPELIIRSSEDPLLLVKLKIFEPLAVNVTAQFPLLVSFEMVSAGTLVQATTDGVLITSISVVAGVVRVGFQFAAVAHDPEVPPCHVYVVVPCPLTVVAAE